MPQAAAGAFSLALARCDFRSPMAQAGAFATCSGGLMPQAAAGAFSLALARCKFRSPMAQAGAFATCSGGLMPQAAARCFLAGASTVQLSFANGTGRCLCHLQWRAYAAGSGRCFLAGASTVQLSFARHWQVPLPRCGDRAEGARPRPLHSPALRQPHPPLRGAFTPSAFLTDRRRFAPAQRRLSRHPCRSPWKASFVQRVGMALHTLAARHDFFRSDRVAVRFLRCIRTARR